MHGQQREDCEDFAFSMRWAPGPEPEKLESALAEQQGTAVDVSASLAVSCEHFSRSDRPQTACTHVH